jgi:hypothetical protein
MKKLILFTILLVAVLQTKIQAQQVFSKQSEVILILNDNSEIRGLIIEEDDNQIVIQNDQLGLLTFQKTDIKKINRLNNKGWIANPNPTKYFIGQSAFSLKKGEGYYQNVMALVNGVQYGITDRLSAGVGVELISLTNGNPIFLANAKYAIPISGKLKFAASGNFLTLLDEGTIGSLSGLATYGSEESNFTFGAGYGIAGGGLTSDVVVTLNGMVRIARRFSLVTENYILPGNNEILNLTGVRLINRRNTMDLMLVQGQIPLVSFVFQF